MALKTAMTLDGKIASFSGDSRWVTGEAARRYVHQLRNTYDAIMAGIGTVLKDDPLLNTRLEGADIRDPVRVIIDGRLNLPFDSQIARTAHKQETLVFCSAAADSVNRRQLEDMQVEIITLDCDPDLIPLQEVLERLGDRGLCSVLVEGGGEINAYLLEHDLIDKVYWFIAPKMIGGRQAPTPIGGQGIELMKDARQLKSIQIQPYAPDLLLTGYFKEW